MVLFLDALQEEGWIVRQPHPDDRRAHAVFLTDQGANRLAAAGPELHKAEEEFLEPLSGRERMLLIEYLRRLARLRGAESA
jgi:DNA-binding MarR family transcriptional regulator